MKTSQLTFKKVKQINSQSDLIWMMSFAGPSYLTIRSSVYIILIWDPCIFNLYNLCQNWIQLHTSGTSAICTPFQWINNKNTFLCYSLLLGQFQLKLFYCGKGRQNFASNVTLYPCERSRQIHLAWQHGIIMAFRLSKTHNFVQWGVAWNQAKDKNRRGKGGLRMWY